MLYMVAGYLIVWAASFVFVFSMVRRQRNLEREIGILKEMAGEPADALDGKGTAGRAGLIEQAAGQQNLLRP